MELHPSSLHPPFHPRFRQSGGHLEMVFQPVGRWDGDGGRRLCGRWQPCGGRLDQSEVAADDEAVVVGGHMFSLCEVAALNQAPGPVHRVVVVEHVPQPLPFAGPHDADDLEAEFGHRLCVTGPPATEETDTQSLLASQ